MKYFRGLILAASMLLLAACGKEGEETMVITGGQEYIYAPQVGEVAQSLPYTVMVGEGEEAQVMSDVTWSIISTSDGASVSADGVVTVTDAYIAGDINGTDIVLQAVSNVNAEQKATVTLHVREAQRVADFELSLAKNAVKFGEKVEISLVNCVDQYGEPMEVPAQDAIKWEYSSESISVDDGILWSRIRPEEPTFAAVCAVVGGVSKEVRFIAHNQEGYQADEATLAKLAEAKIKILKDVDFTQARVVDAATYIYINENVAGLTELAVDVSGLEGYGVIKNYQVTVRNQDGTVVTEDMEAGADGKLALKLQNAAAVEVSPVLKFSLGGCELAAADGYIKVAYDEKYTGQELCGFYGMVSEINGGVNLGGGDNTFVVAVPDGFYSVKIVKPMMGDGRSTVCINGASQGTNVGNGGTGGRTGVRPYSYKMEDVTIEGGTIRITLGEKDFTLASVEVRKTPEITERKVHIYIGGDSTVSNYYPIEASEPERGRFQTGWGQVFAQYVSDENAVTNMAGGGTFAKSWYEMAFPGVIQNGQPGDYFIVHAGINDRTYSSTDEMVEYLTKMIDECREKGIIVVLTTAMQTPKFWKDASGKELGEFGKPEGSGLAAFMEAIRKLAKDKEVFLADVGAMTGEWYSVMGRTYVAQNYHIYNSQTGVEEDTLHLSYHGALKVAEMVATSLAEQQAAGATDGLGNTLDGLSFHDMVTYDVVHKDSTGKEVTTSVTAVEAIYERYGE